MLEKVLRCSLAADAVVTLEDDECVGIEIEQIVVIRRVEEASPIDEREFAFGLRSNVNQLNGLSGGNQSLEVRRWELADGRGSCGA